MKWLLIIFGIVVLIIALIYLIGSRMSIKHTATVEGKFNIGVDQLWEVLIDYPQYSAWRSGIKELVVDSVNHWTEKNSHGDKISYALEVVIDRHTLITRILNKDLPYGGYWEFTITPENNSCIVTITENGEVYNPLFRFMSKYVFGHQATLKNYLTDLSRKIAEVNAKAGR